VVVVVATRDVKDAVVELEEEAAAVEVEGAAAEVVVAGAEKAVVELIFTFLHRQHTFASSCVNGVAVAIKISIV
jgi:hypothetical protein